MLTKSHRFNIFNGYTTSSKTKVSCGKTQHNGIREKIQICEAPRANKFLRAAIYLQDEVFTTIAHLEEESSVFCADLYYHKTCIENSSSYLSIFVILYFL